MATRIPFDSFVLAAVAAELRSWVGARIQKIWQPDPESVVFELHLAGRTTWLWIGWDAEFARAHLSPRKPPSSGEPSTFCMTLRARVGDRHLLSAKQIGFDRVLELRTEDHRLVVELMGKHANAILVDLDGKVAAAGKIVGPSKSRRPILVGRPYEPPPHSDRRSLLDPAPGGPLAGLQGASPFLLSWIDNGGSLDDVRKAVQTERFNPVFVPGIGAYPLSVQHLGFEEVSRESISIALANVYDVAIPAARLERFRTRLLGQLRRVELARETAIADIESVQDAAARARERQTKGELILAFQSQIEVGASVFETVGYDGEPLAIPLDPDLTPVENANGYFEKAKRAKARASLVKDQLERQRQDLAAVRSSLSRVEAARSEVELLDVEADARGRRWLVAQRAPTTREEAPYGGRRIREMLGPGGWTILIGENAEANDYLTLRIAKPDDWWLHVRGGVSAHVVIPTQRKPDKVPREVIIFAAQLAVKRSPQKHASYVPVDYTLRRYVRKVKGAPPGTVLYTHEKTLHVEL